MLGHELCGIEGRLSLRAIALHGIYESNFIIIIINNKGRHATLVSTPQGDHPSLLFGGGKRGDEVTRCPRSPEGRENIRMRWCVGFTLPDTAGRIPPEGGVKTPKKFASGSRLNTREVEAVAAALKSLKSPPPAHIWMRGSWWCQTC